MWYNKKNCLKASSDNYYIDFEFNAKSCKFKIYKNEILVWVFLSKANKDTKVETKSMQIVPSILSVYLHSYCTNRYEQFFFFTKTYVAVQW